MGRRALALFVALTLAAIANCGGDDDGATTSDAGPTTTIDPTADVNVPSDACALLSDADVERLLGAEPSQPGVERGDIALGCTWSAVSPQGERRTLALGIDFGETGNGALVQAAQAPGADALDGIGDEAVLWSGDQAVASYRFVARRGDYYVTLDGRGVTGDEAALRETANALFDALNA